MMQRGEPVARAGWIGRALLIVVVLEVGLMGSGRMLQLGPLTLRMWLYLTGLMYAAVCSFVKPRVSMASLLLCGLLGCLLSVAVAIGVSLHADLALVGEDIKPVSYFFLILFFESAIRTYADVHVVVAALKRVALILCFLYVVVIGLIATKILSFTVVFSAMSKMSGEFVFRGDNGMFVYKGALYIGVGVLLFAFSKRRAARAGVLLCILAMLATGTRVFVLAILGVALLYNLLSRGPSLRKVAMAATAMIVGLAGWAVVGSSKLHAGADIGRVITFEQVANRLSVLTLLVGHGFGKGVPLRPIHMEATYLEIFHKQGILGLVWWLAVLCLLIDRFQRSLSAGNRQLAVPLFLSVGFVAIDSWTDPWITNPIGMAVLLLALACLRILAEPDRGEELERCRGSYLSGSVDGRQLKHHAV